METENKIKPQTMSKEENENIREYGQTLLTHNTYHHNIYLLSIIGEIEGHECLPANSKTTKYEH